MAAVHALKGGGRDSDLDVGGGGVALSHGGGGGGDVPGGPAGVYRSGCALGDLCTVPGAPGAVRGPRVSVAQPNPARQTYPTPPPPEGIPVHGAHGHGPQGAGEEVESLESLAPRSRGRGGRAGSRTQTNPPDPASSRLH